MKPMPTSGARATFLRGERSSHANESDEDGQSADGGIGHLGPYYRMARHNVHANPKGVFFKFGLIGEREILLAGPSDAGLADPGHATALSLLHISSSLLHLNPTLDYMVAIRIMKALADEAGNELVDASPNRSATFAAIFDLTGHPTSHQTARYRRQASSI